MGILMLLLEQLYLKKINKERKDKLKKVLHVNNKNKIKEMLEKLLKIIHKIGRKQI